MKPLTVIKANVQAMFPSAHTVRVTHSHRNGTPAVSIEISADHAIYFSSDEGLLGLVKAFADATGATGFDIYDEHKSRGCDTCDYGAVYKKTYIVW